MLQIARTLLVAFLFTITSLAGGSICRTPVALGVMTLDVPPNWD